MLDLRKLLLASVVLILMSASAFAQGPLSCVAQAAGTPSIRAEGVAELTGDVLIFCYNGTPKALNQNLDQVNIQVFTSPSINVTSRILDSTGVGAFPFTEAMLFIDDPASSKQTICGSSAYPYSVPVGSGQAIVGGVCGAHSGTGNGIGTYDPDVAAGIVGGGTAGNTYRGNAYQARLSGPNSLIWQGIPFDPPGSLTTRVIRLTNVRVNASMLGVPSGSQASVALVISTSASGVGNPIALPITNPAPTVAVAQNSLNFSIDKAKSCLQCEDSDRYNNGKKSDGDFDGTVDGNGCGTMNLRYEELFPSVFRRRNQANPGTAGTTPPTPIDQEVLGFIYQTETGFYRASTNGSRWPTNINNQQGNSSLVAGTSGGTLGLADHGTRLIARFNNVQNGVAVWVQQQAKVYTPQGGNAQTGMAVLVNTDPNGAGPFSAYAGGGGTYAQVSIVGGTGQAVWEIVNADTTAIERIDIKIVNSWTANTTNGLPALGTSTANGNLAPISTVATASATAPLPRFIDTAASKNLLTINSCRSNLLFPFVTNQAGFDTGLAIANTTKDPFGTPLQTGACTVNFYGYVGGSKVTLAHPSPSITGGEHFVWSLANGTAVPATAGFQGYVIAQCNFQYGHGYAFISDLGAQKLAQGYLALVMDQDLTNNTDSVTRTGSRSETLRH